MIGSAAELPVNRIYLFDPVGLINDGYASHGDSETSSPRLWKTSSSSSPAPGCSPPHQPHRRHDHHRHNQPMSPDSRTQAIARGRRELMDIVKDMPESLYELSLRDIVEQKSPPPDDDHNEKKHALMENQKRSGKKVSTSESRKKMARSRSIENGGFLLKTSVFPISFGLKKKKSKNRNASLKVAPKPPLQGSVSSKSIKGAEKDWWRSRKQCAASESESRGLTSADSGSRGSGSSSSSSINSRGHSNRFLLSCCSFRANK